ncbi:MAG: phage tail family protein [Clostridia bacterium]|nr:phage tail family protein [Clostridia bacterium]
MSGNRVAQNYFEYNGVRSDQMGLKIENRDIFGAPAFDKSFITIPGRDGELISSNRRFPNMQIVYTVFLPAESLSDLMTKMTAVKAWLYAEPDRYHELRDTSDTDAYRKAVINAQLDVTQEVKRIGRFTISFSCLPYRYLNSGTEARTFSAAMPFMNPTPFTAKPLIRMNGNGRSGVLKLTHGGVETEWSIDGINGWIEIDSDEMIITDANGLANNRVTGDGFPLLKPGATTVSFSGSISSVELTPRWVVL